MAVVEHRLDADLLSTREQTQLGIIWTRFKRHRLALVSVVVLGTLLLAVIFAPLVAPYDPNYIDREIPDEFMGGFAPPSGEHLLGTDELNRDVLSRLLFAGRISLTIGFTATVLGIGLGLLIGSVAGFYGGIADTLLMRLTDVVLSLPFIPLLLLLSAMLRQYKVESISQDTFQVGYIVIVLVALGWMQSARLVRGSILSLKSQDFVEAARALGASDRRIIARHLLPNAAAPVIVSATLAVGGFIILESAISFLGVGINPPTASWGNMLTNFQSYILQSPVMAVYPGMCIFLTVLCINFIGDGLRDALDPRMKV